MTDNTQPEALRLANVCSNLTRYSMDAHVIAAELRRQHARIAELEAQLEAIGAGGVSGPLMGCASIAASAVSEPVAWLVCSVNSDGTLSLEHAAAWKEAAHEHINDAITEHGIDEAASWVVRPAYTHPSPPGGMAGWKLVPVEPTEEITPERPIMTNQQGAPEALRLAEILEGEHAQPEALRLAKYVARRKLAKQLDVNEIHGFDSGCDTEAVLLLSDIEAVLAQVAALTAAHWGEYPALPDADRDYMRKVVAVAVTVLFDGHKEDVMRVFSTGELSELVTITAAMRGEQVEDIYRRAWDLLSLPDRASHGQAPAQAAHLSAAQTANCTYPACQIASGCGGACGRQLAQAAPAAVARPSDLELLAEWDRVSTIAEAGERRLAVMRAVLAKWGAAPITHPAPRQEAQEPVAWQSRTRPTWGGNDRPWSPWEPCTKSLAEDCWKTPLLHDWAYEARALYTAPQPSPASQADSQPAVDALAEAEYFIDNPSAWSNFDKRASDAIAAVCKAFRASHGQAPARADMQDAYVGAREDLAIWKRRALEAERDLRAERETASRLAAEINAINGPTHLGEPAPTAQPAPAATPQADSQPAPVREEEREAFKAAHRHLELDEVPDAWGRPMFKYSHVEASWLGWIARASHGQAPAQAAPAAVEGCTRSHPHENMDSACRAKAAIAEMQNMAARGAEATAHDLDRFVAMLAAAPITQPAPAPVPDWLPFSKRTQIADRHGVKVTAEFNALVRDVIQTYLETHADRAARAPADSVTAPAGERENLDLRRMLCVAHAGAAAYMDDGEAQDSRDLPVIDFLRDTPAEIQDKLQRRVLKKLVAGATTPPAQTADSVLEDAARAGFFLQLPQRPKPEAPAGTVGLDWDAYSGAQMLAYGRDCSNAAIVAAQKPGGL